MIPQVLLFSQRIGLLCAGLLIGALWQAGQSASLPAISPARAEVTIIELQSLLDDQLEFEIFGPGRVLWADDKLLEGSGVHQIPLGQLPNAQDLKFQDFYYTGNAKTGKFYPSSSYPARGTAVRDRRFFETKQAAIQAGFIATKLVK